MRGSDEEIRAIAGYYDRLAQSVLNDGTAASLETLLRAAQQLPPSFAEMRFAVTEAAAQRLQVTAHLAANARRTETALLELADLLTDITKNRSVHG